MPCKSMGQKAKTTTDLLQTINQGTCQTLEIDDWCVLKQPIMFSGRKNPERSKCACNVRSSRQYYDAKHYAHEHMKFINKESHEVYMGFQLDPAGDALVYVFSLE